MGKCLHFGPMKAVLCLCLMSAPAFWHLTRVEYEITPTPIYIYFYLLRCQSMSVHSHYLYCLMCSITIISGDWPPPVWGYNHCVLWVSGYSLQNGSWDVLFGRVPILSVEFCWNKNCSAPWQVLWRGHWPLNDGQAKQHDRMFKM